uniref:C3H1-type domain-containing protein n=1 Tax=viral metagenome TaxID=1070528 RepID=A0A6C0KEU2_9ZZZZ
MEVIYNAPFCHLNCDNEFNILGFYKLTPKEPKFAPWANFKNVYREKQEEKISNRDKGFSILSSRKNVVTYLKNTKFCNLLINQGKCTRETCNFAHSSRDINFPLCAFGEECTKQDSCQFRHPDETIESYKDRINFTIPPNIQC